MRYKMITINDYRDYNKFLKKVNLYKSILYYNTFFVLKNNTCNSMIDYMISALNIKSHKKRINFIYDESCKIINEKVNGFNICGFKDGKCYVQQNLKNSKCNGCCRMCIYQTDSGCSTINLTCKLFNCSEVTSRYDVMTSNDLKILKVLSFKNQLIIKSDYFSKREDVLKDLYSYSLIYSAIRMFYRIIRNFVYFNVVTKLVVSKKNKL